MIGLIFIESTRGPYAVLRKQCIQEKKSNDNVGKICVYPMGKMDPKIAIMFTLRALRSKIWLYLAAYDCDRSATRRVEQRCYMQEMDHYYFLPYELT